MAKLQACAKCGAQFDVAAMTSGQRFTCGACGAVVTVGAPASIGAAAAPSRPIPAPSRPVPAPASKGAGSRGPQYVPIERSAGAAPAPAKPGRGARDEERPSRERGGRGGAPKKGMSPAAMAGIGGGLLVGVVVLLLATSKKDEPKKGPGSGSTVAGTNPATAPGMGGVVPAPDTAMGGATPGMDAAMGPDGARPGDTLATVTAEWSTLGHPSSSQYRDFMKRFLAVSGGKDKAKDLASEVVKQVDPNDKTARELLGHFEFAYDVPEEISFTKGYPFIRVVEESHAQRWFEDKEGFDLAVKAYEKTKAHAKRLLEDRVYRALDGARQEVERDPYFRRYNYDARFASPYLICYSTDEQIDFESLYKLPKAERSKKWAELEKKREGYEKILSEKAKIYTQLYAEFLKRYGEECDLHPLMDEFAGRPDYPVTKRTFRDGRPLMIWIFSDRKAFDDYHNNVKGEGIAQGVAGYFSPATGWVYLYDEDSDKSDREFEINKNVHEGTHQLQHWFTKQKNEWGKPFVPQSFFGEGFAEYIGSVTMAKDRALKFVGVNRPRLKSLKGIKKQLSDANKKMYVYPLKELTAFEGYHNVQAWAVQNWRVDPGFALGLFYIQSWAFVYFLNEENGKKNQAKFNKYVDDMLNYPRDTEGYGATQFKKRLDIKTDDDWKKLQKDFDAFYDKLLKMDDDKVGPPPPDRDDWPGYVPLTDEATGPTEPPK